MPRPPLPIGTPTDTPTPLPPEAARYIVQPGDTLLSIAEDYGASLSVLMAANQIDDPSRLRIGQELVIVPGTPTPEPTATPLPPPTATPGPPSPSPALVWPRPGYVFDSAESVVLIWASTGLLAQDEWYLLRVSSANDPAGLPLEVWVKGTSWRAPAGWAGEVMPGHIYHWEVWVVEGATTTGADGAILREVRSFLSGPGEGRTFSVGE